MLSVEKPGTPEELVHFGVKGMKWGVRSGSRSTSRNPGKKKLTSDDILRARARTNMDYTKFLVAKGKANQIKTKKAYLNNPDRATAMRLTRGEKAVFGVLALTGIATIPIAVGLGVNVGIRKRIESKQAKKRY